MRRGLAALTAGLLLSGCSTSAGAERTIVASVYPVAFAVEGMADPSWKVVNLASPGVEVHDLDLSLEQRTAIEEADFLIYLGDIGFQPQVEQAVTEADGKVIDLSVDLRVHDGVTDPHIWLNPVSFFTIVLVMAQDVICPFDDPCTQEEHLRVEAFKDRFSALQLDYSNGLLKCQHDTMVVSHEAFGYLEEFYGLEQFGLSGLTPEAEPTVTRLAQARALIDSGRAGAVFFEEHEDARSIAESFASEAGVPAFPLSTLEAQPVQGDYFSEMEDNLESLREGLQCR
jgi:zinc transport system substrate-binding protein